MSLKNITLIIEPYPEPTQDFKSEEYDRFAEELQKYTQAKVNIFEGFLSDASDADFFLLYTWDITESLNRCKRERLQYLQQRLVLTYTFVQGGELLELVERFNLAAGLGLRVYKLWQVFGELVPLTGLLGLTSIAEEICTDYYSFSDKQYCRMQDLPFNSLPAQLIRYLEVYDKRILGSADTTDLNYLLTTLNCEDVDVRREIIFKLGNIPDNRAVSALQSSLDDSDWIVRTRVARALTHYAQLFGLELDLYPILIQMINQDPHSEVKRNTVRQLVEYAKGNNLDIRVTLHEFIGQHSDKEVRSAAFIQLLQHIENLGLAENDDLSQVIKETPDETIKILAKRQLDEAKP